MSDTCKCEFVHQTDGPSFALFCPEHYADLDAELQREPRIVPALLAAVKKWSAA